jgi:hypothetical protein
MGTLVSPILSATLAMPFARLWMERHAWEEREARLSIVDDAEVDRVWGESVEMVLFILFRMPSCSGPSPTSNRGVSNFPRAIVIGPKCAKRPLGPKFMPGARVPRLLVFSVFSHLNGWFIERSIPSTQFN